MSMVPKHERWVPDLWVTTSEWGLWLGVEESSKDEKELS